MDQAKNPFYPWDTILHDFFNDKTINSLLQSMVNQDMCKVFFPNVLGFYNILLIIFFGLFKKKLNWNLLSTKNNNNKNIFT